MNEELEYYERQKFPWWTILLLAMINIPLITGCIIQLGMGKPWGDKPMSDMMLIIVTVLVALFTTGFSFIHVETVINKEGVWMRAFPFRPRFKLTPWDYISEAVVRKMNLLKDKRGIGYKLAARRIGTKGIRMVGRSTYNLSGNYVLDLMLKNNKKILIGTRKPEEVTEFLNKLDAERKQE